MKAQNNNDWIDTYFDRGIDRKNRRIFMFDDVDEGPIGTVIKGLYYMDAESNKPIELFIASFGGSEYEMFALHDVIQSIKSPVHTIAIGKNMSAAPLLVACGEPGHRYATPNTWFMVHQSWEDFGPKRTDELKKDLAHYDVMSKRWYDLMVQYTNKDLKFWRTHCEGVGDHYFDAKMAQEVGLIDGIWRK